MELVLEPHSDFDEGSYTTADNVKSWIQENQKTVKAMVRLMSMPPNENLTYSTWISTTEGVKPLNLRPLLDEDGDIEIIIIEFETAEGEQEMMIRKTPRTMDGTPWALPSSWDVQE